MDNGKIGKIGGLVDNRNEMAHANGRFTILTEDAFSASANGICDSVRNIHYRMNGQIRIWFKDFLLRYCDKKFAEYDEVSDIIIEQMIQGFNLSVQELLVCNEMSVILIISEKSQCKDSLNKFKKTLREYCEEQGFVIDSAKKQFQKLNQQTKQELRKQVARLKGQGRPMREIAEITGRFCA